MQYIETCQLGQGRAEGAPDNPEMNGPGHVPIPLHFWTLQSEVHIILICWKSFDFFFSPNHVTKTGGRPDVAPDDSLLTPVRRLAVQAPNIASMPCSPLWGRGGPAGKCPRIKAIRI